MSCPSPSSCWLQMALLGSGQLFKGIGFLESQHEKKCRLSGQVKWKSRAKPQSIMYCVWFTGRCLGLATFEVFLNCVFQFEDIQYRNWTMGRLGQNKSPPSGLTLSIAKRCLGRNGRTSRCTWFFLKHYGASSGKGFPASPALCTRNCLLQVCFEPELHHL